MRPDVRARGVLCVVDADLPVLGTLRCDGYPLLYRRALAKRLKARGPLDDVMVRTIADELLRRLPAA